MTGESYSGRITAAATFTIVTCHFGDLFWIEQLTSLIDRTTLPAQVPEIVIVNQQRSTQTTELLASLPKGRSSGGVRTAPSAGAGARP